MHNSNLNTTIFVERNLTQSVAIHTPIYPRTASTKLIRSSIVVIDGKCRKYRKKFCNLKHLKLEGNYPKPNWDLSFLKEVLWVGGISNDLNGSSRKTAHIFTNLKLGGSKWLH
tara:strand:- start:5776 stop:6114 length:339 start_codon:yes stop_codon:yes gene_type:complete